MSPTTAPTKKTVVVADDTAFVRDRFRTALESAGYRVLTVRTSTELLALIQASLSEIDLLVLDCQLSQSNCLGLVRTVRRLNATRPSIVVFSGTIESPDQVRALAALSITGYINEYTSAPNIVPSLAPYLFPDRAIRRSSPRVVLSVAVSYRVNNTIAGGVTLNVSSGGLAIRTANPLPAETKVRLRFRLPGASREVDTDARVAWSDRRVGMGLQFLQLDAADQALVDTFVHAHFFTNRRA